MDNGSVTERPDQQFLPRKRRADKRTHGCGEPVVLWHQDASGAGKHEIIGQDSLTGCAIALAMRPSKRAQVAEFLGLQIQS